MSAQTYTKNISADPLDLINRDQLNVTYEQKLSPENSFTVFASYVDLGGSVKDGSGGWSGFGIGASYRWYFDIGHQNKTPLEGLSVGPIAALTFFNYTHGFDEKTDAYLAIGGEASYKFVILDGLSIEPTLKLMFAAKKIDYMPSSYDPWGIGVNVGYAW